MIRSIRDRPETDVGLALEAEAAGDVVERYQAMSGHVVSSVYCRPNVTRRATRALAVSDQALIVASEATIAAARGSNAP